MKIRFLIIFVLCLGVGASGRFCADAIPSRQIDGVSLAADQLLGGLRSLPLIRLWQRVYEAKDAGRYEEVQALYDLITEIDPSNGQVVYQQAINEGRDIAALQATPEEAWVWVKSALVRLEESRERGVASAEPYNAEFLIGHRIGRQMPLRFLRFIANSYRDRDLQEITAGLEAHGLSATAKAFLEKHWEKYRTNFEPLESDEFAELPRDDRAFLSLCDEAVTRALKRIAEAGIAEPRFQSSTSVRYALAASQRGDSYRRDRESALAALLAEMEQDAPRYEHEIAQVKAKLAASVAEREAAAAYRLGLITSEFARLNQDGYPYYADSFREVALHSEGLDSDSN